MLGNGEWTHLWEHTTKRHSLMKYLLVLGVVVGYFAFVSLHYGWKDGILITILTWSFFVFCTPVADAGFLLDFPIRLITGMRMIKSELMVWVIAFIINAMVMWWNPSIYHKTFLLRLFHYIITHPIPMWLIVVLSAAGTFLSIYFGDEMLDVIEHKDREAYHKHGMKYSLILMVFVIGAIIVLYKYLVDMMGLQIPL